MFFLLAALFTARNARKIVNFNYVRYVRKIVNFKCEYLAFYTEIVVGYLPVFTHTEHIMWQMKGSGYFTFTNTELCAIRDKFYVTHWMGGSWSSFSLSIFSRAVLNSIAL